MLVMRVLMYLSVCACVCARVCGMLCVCVCCVFVLCMRLCVLCVYAVCVWQVALFILCVSMLFWQLGWRPYASREDNFLAIALAGCQAVVAGLEIFVVSTLLNNPQDYDGSREVRVGCMQ